MRRKKEKEKKASLYAGTLNALRDAGKQQFLRRADVALILGIAAAALLLLGLYARQMRGVRAPALEIVAGGEVYGRYPLTENRVIAIGDTNTCEIKDGVVRMTRANCPDQVCVHTPPITKNGGTIVCLPNEIVLRIVNGETGDIDMAAQ